MPKQTRPKARIKTALAASGTPRIIARPSLAKHSKAGNDGMVRARINSDLKQETEAILVKLGLNPSQAIRLFYAQITLSGGLPFDVKIPNATTIRAMEASRAGKVTRYSSPEEMFKKMAT